MNPKTKEGWSSFVSLSFYKEKYLLSQQYEYIWQAPSRCHAAMALEHSLFIRLMESVADK